MQFPCGINDFLYLIAVERYGQVVGQTVSRNGLAGSDRTQTIKNRRPKAAYGILDCRLTEGCRLSVSSQPLYGTIGRVLVYYLGIIGSRHAC